MLKNILNNIRKEDIIQVLPGQIYGIKIPGRNKRRKILYVVTYNYLQNNHGQLLCQIRCKLYDICKNSGNIFCIDLGKKVYSLTNHGIGPLYPIYKNLLNAQI